MKSKSQSIKVLLVLLLGIMWVGFVTAAENQKHIYMDSQYYSYLDYLINSGRQVPDFILQQPYCLGNVDSLNQSINNHYIKYWQKYYTANLISGQLDLQDRVRHSEKIINRFKASGSIHMVTPYMVFANRTVFDQHFKNDPNYAGDLSESENWLYGRVSDAYMQFSYHNLGIFIMVLRYHKPGIPITHAQTRNLPG